MKEHQSFQKDFFSYQLPVPFVTLYSKECAKNNDLRLLMEITTKSHLRMYTDVRTHAIHFICKNKGNSCLDIEANHHQSKNGYFFDSDCRYAKHTYQCQLQGPQFKYLQIYNLMKLKKDLIESFMINNDIMNQSPSTILNKISNNASKYFFQKYLEDNLQLRRKLRKRFDNIVNIDIKKIGKPQEKVELIKITPEKTRVVAQPVQHFLTAIKKQFTNSNVKTGLNQDQFKVFIEETIQSKVVMKNSENKQKLQIDETRMEQNMNKALNLVEILKSSIEKGKYISKLSKSKRSKRKRKGKKNLRKKQQQMIKIRQSIIILPQKTTDKQQEIFFESESKQSLPQLNVLNEHAQYNWSSSEQSQPNAQIDPFEVIQINKEDYFKSLRNSTLKKSLERDSLVTVLFPYDLPKQN